MSVPATLVDYELELDVLTSIIREPYRAARLFVTLDPATFAIGAHRGLYRALRTLEWPAARWEATRGRDGVHVGRWHVDGLEGALSADKTLNASVAAERLYRALDDAPLLPFSGAMLTRHRELHRRRTFYAHVELRIPDADLTLPARHLVDSLMAEYALTDPLADVFPIEVALTELVVP